MLQQQTRATNNCHGVKVQMAKLGSNALSKSIL
ncbi:hypothetical protein CYB_0867 [Synechococcus sp. JA-2-3B'a(2-13)]|nr:hypothetical protein CYB_0867 [Synechococcus sp. JA-2-3B'a(2-13)]